MNCEICGQESRMLYEVIYLGRRTYACENCVDKYGLTIIKKLGKKERREASQRRLGQTKSISMTRSLPISDFELIENYGYIIRRKREELGMTQEDLAKKLKVKLSYIKKVESNKIIPEYELVNKLEKILGVKLIESVDDEELPLSSSIEEVESPTLGDYMFKNSREW
ncbi:MAG TPA: TIGR00270 family protein [Thermoprotei archaeon]|nr:TIGR00270 family protein [Thermoprotei archaeon]